MSSYCPDCGELVNRGMCSNCQEELYIYEFQADARQDEPPLSDEFMGTARGTERLFETEGFSMKTEHAFREMDQRIEATLVAHAENLKAAIENGRCPRCGDDIRPRLNERNITFKCDATVTECGWSAIYPIRTLGNSERAQQDEILDLVAISEREVIEKAKALSRVWRSGSGAKIFSAGDDLLLL